MSITVGIDMGSTTVKFVILNEHNEILYKSYDRHKSKAKEMVYDKFKSLKSLLANEKIALAITGSAGLGFAHLGNLPFVQEVFACGEAVKNMSRSVMSSLNWAARMPNSVFKGCC